MKPVRILAIILMVLGAAMIIIGISLPGIGSDGNNNDNGQLAYTLSNVVYTGVGGFLLATGLMMFFFLGMYQPITEAPPLNHVPVVSERSEVGSSPHPTDEDNLVLRLLSGDERTMYRAIVDNGGEALQKDLILNLKWSDAKVSRVIDRLIEKGVVTKERHGSTNKVRLSIEK